jgi:exoribonuclease R
VRSGVDASGALHDGFARIAAENHLPGPFPAAVEAAAADAARRPVAAGPDRRDARHLPMVTLDPAGSTDLDQAFALEQDGDDVVLHYAIADVGFFVDRGGPVEAEAWRRGATVYLPTSRIPQYPTVLCEGAASLLPDRDRPAMLLTVVVALDGAATLRSAERAVVRSRAQLAYETVRAADLPPLLAELARRVTAAEDARGASRVEFPDQEVVRDPGAPGGLALRLRPRLAAEDQNADLSLAANLAVAQAMLAARTGLFRVMPEPAPPALRMLRRTARVLGVAWPEGATLRALRIDPADPRHAAFLLAARRAGGSAGYAVYEPGERPWHAAIAAPYAHATAPLRRLADRYVLDLVCALHAGGAPTEADLATLAALPDVMARAGAEQSRVDRAAVDLVEAVTLRDRVGEVFEAEVTDVDRAGVARIQLADPAVRTKLALAGAEPGQRVRVRLDGADAAARQVRFSVVA